MKRCCLVFALLLIVAAVTFPHLATAQDSTTPRPGTWTYTEFNNTYTCFGETTLNTLDDMDERFQVEFTLLVEDGGDTLIFVFDGADIIYTRTSDTTYEGAVLDPLPIPEFSATLTVAHAELMDAIEQQSYSEDCVSNYANAYVFVSEESPQIWTETTRDFSDLSFFNECLGRTGITEAPDAWVLNDVLVPLSIAEDGSIIIGTRVFAADEGTFVYEDVLSAAGTSSRTVTTLTPVSEWVYDVDVLFRLDEREDCQVVYTSQLVSTDWEEWENYVGVDEEDAEE